MRRPCTARVRSVTRVRWDCHGSISGPADPAIDVTKINRLLLGLSWHAACRSVPAGPRAGGDQEASMRRRARLGWLRGRLAAVMGGLLLFSTSASAAGIGPVLGGALPGPLPLFPPDNWWNVDISAAPVDPGSAGFITFVGASTPLHPDLGGDSSPAPAIYGMVY